MTKFFKNRSKPKLVDVPTSSVPRSMDEINKANHELLYKVGQAQYLAHVYKEETAALNKILIALNQEGKARQDLDKQASLDKSIADINEPKATK